MRAIYLRLDDETHDAMFRAALAAAAELGRPIPTSTYLAAFLRAVSENGSGVHGTRVLAILRAHEAPR